MPTEISGSDVCSPIPDRSRETCPYLSLTFPNPSRTEAALIMNWKAIAKTLGHAALGGAAVGLVDSSHSIIVPVAVSALTSVISAFADSPNGKSLVEIVKGTAERLKP
jgi:hypothetical protein